MWVIFGLLITSFVKKSVWCDWFLFFASVVNDEHFVFLNWLFYDRLGFVVSWNFDGKCKMNIIKQRWSLDRSKILKNRTDLIDRGPDCPSFKNYLKLVSWVTPNNRNIRVSNWQYTQLFKMLNLIEINPNLSKLCFFFLYQWYIVSRKKIRKKIVCRPTTTFV